MHVIKFIRTCCFGASLLALPFSSAFGETNLMPGADCNEPGWCLAVTPDGRIFVGNPTGFGEPRMADTRRKPLWSEKDGRSITIRCLPTRSVRFRDYVCWGIDSHGNLYGGDSRDPNDPQFFQRR